MALLTTFSTASRLRVALSWSGEAKDTSISEEVACGGETERFEGRVNFNLLKSCSMKASWLLYNRRLMFRGARSQMPSP